MTSKTWLTFDEQDSTGRITRIWAVRSAGDRSVLGVVKWHSPWRQYTFFTMSYSSIWNADCLVELADFCTNQNELHRAGLSRLMRAVSWSTEDET